MGGPELPRFHPPTQAVTAHPKNSPRWIQAAGWILLAKLIYLGTVFGALKVWNHPEQIPKLEVRWPMDADPTF